jgi:hypothetical protein
MTATTVSVFQRVASRELTPEVGASLIMAERKKQWQKPEGMPRWLWVAGVVLFAVIFAPLMSSRNDAR